MAVIFPFEVDVFAGSGLRVDFVGHPLVDPLRAVREKIDRAAARAALGVAGRTSRSCCCCPARVTTSCATGCRSSSRPPRALRARVPDARFVLALAPTVRRAGSTRRSRRSPCRVDVVEGRTHEAMIAADVALVKPGTASLELALLGCPHVAAGRANPLSVGARAAPGARCRRGRCRT